MSSFLRIGSSEMFETNTMSTSLVVHCEYSTALQKLVANFFINWIHFDTVKNVLIFKGLNNSLPSVIQTINA